jgi:crossover junction endodeoxyribonuclease RuvC
MVRALLGLEDDRIPLDASDALATAICHLNTRLYQLKVEGQEPS